MSRTIDPHEPPRNTALFFAAMLIFLVVSLFFTACAPSDTTAPPQVHQVAQRTPYTGTSIGVGTHGSFEEARIMGNLGVKHTRFTYSYTHGSLPHLKDRMQDLRNHQLEPLVVIHDYFPYAVIPDFCEIVKAIPGSTFQIGNEHDAYAPWGVRLYRGSDYAYLMAMVVPRMRQCDPTVKVVGMGLAVTDGRPWSVMADLQRTTSFTEEYLASPFAIPLDAWSIHAYGYPLAPAVEARVNAVRATLNRYGSTMPLWITEVGMDRENFEKAVGLFPQVIQRVPYVQFVPWELSIVDGVQSQEIIRALEVAKSLQVERVYLYQLWDNLDDGFGLLRSDAKTPRPAYEALRGYLQR